MNIPILTDLWQDHLRIRVIRTADRPRGFWGGFMIMKMNLLHTPLSRWGLGFVSIPSGGRCLDIGCGGGRNLGRLLARSGGRVEGLDLSALSVERSLIRNLPAVLHGQVGVQIGTASSLPWRDGYFDAVTAFETVYYWPDLPAAFREVRRVLRHGGTFLICNEDRASLEDPHAHDEVARVLPIRFYTDDQLKAMLVDAGFDRVQVHVHKNGSWVSLTAHKN